MSQPETKLVTPVSLLVDAILVIAFFIYMYSVLSTHVPSNDHRMIVIWGLISTSCLTGVFWLALQMFRVTFRAQREANRNKR
jgi:RsiW-degrading membrane proteinase PrsW (M82 family)